MAIVVYKCDTCKREIEIQRNIDGVEHVGRCNITHGCRGKLYQVNLHPDFVRGSLPDPVIGLDDWKSRKVLYNHQQAIERDEWIIEHDMGVIPIVSVYGDQPIEGDLNNRVEIVPDDIIIVDDNTVRLVFSRSWSGMAQLVARQSDPDLFKTVTRESITVIEPTQISNTGELTIATKVGSIPANANVTLDVLFVTPNGPNVTVQYTADTAPSLVSPWVDYDEGIIIKGQIYKVRSFAALIPEMTSGAIGSGSTFIFTGIDTSGGTNPAVPIASDDVLILLATSPFQTVDKVTDEYINVTDVSSTENSSGFFYNNGEFYATAGLERSVYPPIRSV